MSTQTPETILNVSTTTLRSMVNMEEHRIIQLLSLEMLRIFSSYDISNEQYVMEKGGILVVLFAADNFLSCLDIQEKCFDFIFSLRVDPETCQIIGSEVGINDIVEGMTTHVTEKVFQEAGVLALKALMKDSTACIDMIEILGGIDIICLTMQVHADNTILHENSLSVIINLITTKNPTNHVKIILDYLATHIDSKKLQQWCFQCLKEMMQS